MAKRFWRILLLLPLFFTCFFGCSAETYPITAEELTILESQLLKLKLNNNELKTLIATSVGESTKAQNEVNELMNQLTELKALNSEQEKSLTRTRASLMKANQLLDEFEREQKKALKKSERKKTAWQVVAIAAVVWGVSK